MNWSLSTYFRAKRENLEQLLLGEVHWGEENWAPSFYAFERVINGLGPLIDEGGMGSEKANELEARYSEVSESITHEIVLVEGAYFEAIENANCGYNALEERDWITVIQSFAKALDILNLVKAKAAEIVDMKLQDAHFFSKQATRMLRVSFIMKCLLLIPIQSMRIVALN